jgi:uncharacterized protein YdaU (DUF1376 family)
MTKKRSKSPAFQLYAADFLTDTQSMSAQELGVYFRLMCSQWINKGVPVDAQKLSRLAGVSVKVFKKIWPEIEHKFTEKEVDGVVVLINERLEESRADKEKYIESQSLKGKISADKRRMEKEKENVTRVENRLEPKSNSSTSSSSSTSLKEKRNKKESLDSEKEIEKEFLEDWNVWKKYKVGGKPKALGLYSAHRKKHKREIFIEARKNRLEYINLKYGNMDFVPMLQTHLNSKEEFLEWINGSDAHEQLLILRNTPKAVKTDTKFKSKDERMEDEAQAYRNKINNALGDVFDNLDFPDDNQQFKLTN